MKGLFLILAAILLVLVQYSLGFICNENQSSWKPSSRLRRSQRSLIMKLPSSATTTRVEKTLFRFIFNHLDHVCSGQSTTTTTGTQSLSTSSYQNSGDDNDGSNSNTLFIQSIYNKLKKRINTPYLKQFFLGPPIPKIKEKNRYRGNPATWMKGLGGMIGNEPLNRLVIPGTRASFSSFIHDYSMVSPDGNRNELFIYKTLKYYPKNVLNRVQARWSKTQTRSALLQLRDGIRYFDIRVCKDRSSTIQSTMLKSCNTMFDRPIEESMNEILLFITKESPQEVVILDFSHFFDMNSKDHTYLFSFLSTKFRNLLIDSNTIKPSSSLNEIWKNSKQQRIIIIYNEEEIVRKSKGLFWSPSHSIQYMRPVGKSIHELYMKVSMGIKQREEEAEAESTRHQPFFFAIQFKITPDNFMVASGIIGKPSSAMELGHFYNPEIVNWLSTQDIPRKSTNIIMIDNYSDNLDIMSVILQQNVKV